MVKELIAKKVNHGHAIMDRNSSGIWFREHVILLLRPGTKDRWGVMSAGGRQQQQ